jgi:hypothetical protein
LKVLWHAARDDEPSVMYSELDERRMQTRKIDIYADGRWGFADSSREQGGSALAEAPTPPLESLNADPEYEAEEITASDFEALWQARSKARVMDAFPIVGDQDGS